MKNKLKLRALEPEDADMMYEAEEDDGIYILPQFRNRGFASEALLILTKQIRP